MLNIFKALLSVALVDAAILVVCAHSALSSEPDGVDYVLGKVVEANEGISSLSASITMTRSIPLLESSEVSRGRLTCQPPEQFCIKFDPPRNEVNIMDGKYIWVYHVDLNQAERYSAGDIGADSLINIFMDNGLGQAVETLRERYDITLTGRRAVSSGGGDGGRGVEVKLYNLLFLPGEGSGGGVYSEIRLWVDSELWLPRVIELRESGGEILTRIELDNVSVDKSGDIRQLECVIPGTVELIEPLK